MAHSTFKAGSPRKSLQLYLEAPRPLFESRRHFIDDPLRNGIFKRGDNAFALPRHPRGGCRGDRQQLQPL